MLMADRRVDFNFACLWWWFMVKSTLLFRIKLSFGFTAAQWFRKNREASNITHLSRISSFNCGWIIYIISFKFINPILHLTLQIKGHHTTQKSNTWYYSFTTCGMYVAKLSVTLILICLRHIYLPARTLNFSLESRTLAWALKLTRTHKQSFSV